MRSLRTLIAVVFAGLVGVLSGCATVPTPEVMKAETASFNLPKQPEPGKALVYVVRPSAVGALIRFNVFVDDQKPESEVGFTRGSQHIYFNVKPGERKIYSKAENWAEISVNAKEGETIFLFQDASMGFVMARNSLTRIDDVTGKYQVKKTSLGTILKSEK